MARQKQQAPFFRWQALEWAQRTSAALAGVIAAGVLLLSVNSVVTSTRVNGTGQPHNPVSLVIFNRPSPTPKPSPTPIPTPIIPRIGIVSGHRGNDVGAICKDGLTEAAVNYDIASRVAAELRLRGYRVDLLDEFDPRLTGYRALLLLSIHADSCEYINDKATGFKVARAVDSHVPDQEGRLVQCLVENYAKSTGLRFHKDSITSDMTSYHGFYEIAPDTPAAIIETGFLRLDRAILTQRPDLVTQGIVEGILCFLNAGGAP